MYIGHVRLSIVYILVFLCTPQLTCLPIHIYSIDPSGYVETPMCRGWTKHTLAKVKEDNILYLMSIFLQILPYNIFLFCLAFDSIYAPTRNPGPIPDMHGVPKFQLSSVHVQVYKINRL